MQFQSSNAQRQIPQNQPVHLLTSDGRPSGCFVQDGTLYRRAQASRHLWRRPPSWAFDVRVLQRARELGATRVVVIDEEQRITYEASLEKVERGFTVQHGWGEQKALPLNCWRRHDPQQPTLF